MLTESDRHKFLSSGIAFIGVLVLVLWVGDGRAQNHTSESGKETSTMQPLFQSPDNPQNQEEWELWYIDTFDREFPPRVDVRGRGLKGGLTELWARHMFETVRPNGQTGFSSFYLKLKQGRIEISGDREGATRLREWLYGKKETSYKGYVAEADTPLLEKVATAHLHILGKGQKAAEILAAAKTAKDAADFMNRLDQLLQK